MVSSMMGTASFNGILPLIDMLGHSVFIGSEKTFTIEVYDVGRGLGNPDFGFPRDVI